MRTITNDFASRVRDHPYGAGQNRTSMAPCAKSRQKKFTVENGCAGAINPVSLALSAGKQPLYQGRRI